MRTDDGRIDHLQRGVRHSASREPFQDHVPDATVGPPPKLPKDRIPVAEALRQVAPWCAGSHQPKHRVEHAAMIAWRPAAAAMDQERFEVRPLIVGHQSANQGCPPQRAALNQLAILASIGLSTRPSPHSADKRRSNDTGAKEAAVSTISDARSSTVASEESAALMRCSNVAFTRFWLTASATAAKFPNRTPGKLRPSTRRPDATDQARRRYHPRAHREDQKDCRRSVRIARNRHRCAAASNDCSPVPTSNFMGASWSPGGRFGATKFRATASKPD